jgi:hypothetical protein
MTESDRTLRKSVPRVLAEIRRRGRRRRALEHELALCWGSPREHVDELAAIRALTERLAERLTLRDGRTDFGKKVSFEDARRRGIHRWYYYKEGFSPSLLGLLLKQLDVPKHSVYLDPFAGVATSVLSATQLDPSPFRRAIGVEYNPFAHFVGRTKLRWDRLSPKRLRALAEEVVAYQPTNLPAIPASATVRNTEIFSRSRRDAIRRLLAGVEDLARPGAERDVLRLAIAAVLEPTSFAKKDGRALRIVDPKERRVPPRTLFQKAVLAIARDVEIHKERAQRRRAAMKGIKPLKARLYRGDARRLPTQVASNSVGLALYSPPYLNGIDYSEVYKVEEFFLGFVRSAHELRRLREGTLRSHASIHFKPRVSRFDELPATVSVRRVITAIATFLEKHETRGFQKQYAWLVPAFFADMYEALCEQRRVLRPGGYAVCVIGNSMLAGPSLESVQSDGSKVHHPRWQLPIATDVIIAQLARLAGLRVLRSFAVRALVPRNVPRSWSRESILIFRRPKVERRREGGRRRRSAAARGAPSKQRKVTPRGPRRTA